jgi:hypothetical protein
MKKGPSLVELRGALLSQVQKFGYVFPQNPLEQAYDAIRAVALSWKNRVARSFVESFALESDILPSVFIQEKSFASLKGRSYAAFATRDPKTGSEKLYGDFALDTEGRFMMRGICRDRRDIMSIDRYFPGMLPVLEGFSRMVEALYKRPQDIEAIIDGENMETLQVTDSHLELLAYSKVEQDLRKKKILGPEERIPSIDEIRRTLVLKTYRLDPEAEVTTIDTGIPASNGAVMGRLALSIRAARKLKSMGEKVVLLLDVPDDRALDLILGRQIDGLATTYASTHDEVAARASHITTVMAFKGLVIEESRIINVAEGIHIAEGSKIILDADSGSLMIAKGRDPLIANGVEIFTPHDIDGLKIYQQIREDYKMATYAELLLAHAEEVDRSKYLSDQVEKMRLELKIHSIHLMILEKGEEQGKNRLTVNLDVAVADGNLKRLPGFEKKNFFIRPDKDEFIIVTGSEDDNEGYDSQGGPIIEGVVDVNPILVAARERGLELERFYRTWRPTGHTQFISEFGISTAGEKLEDVVQFLQEYFSN